MVGAGMPELSDLAAIDYLKDQLYLHLSDREASSQLEKMMKQVLIVIIILAYLKVLYDMTGPS